MIKNWIKKYKNLSFEDRTIFHAKFSILFNCILAIIKIILGVLFNTVFLVTAVVNIFMMLSRFECLQGIIKPKKKTFCFRNTFVAVCLILAGIQYTVYMIFLLLNHFETRTYSQALGIGIAFVSFIELGVAIKGCFNAYGKGHYYRNIKLINLCSAFTAIGLTAIAITSFTAPADNLECLVGITVGVWIILSGIYVLVAPKVSIIDKVHNMYLIEKGMDFTTKKDINIPLTNSKVYGNYVYVAQIKNNIVDGNIVKERSPLFKIPILLKIVLIILSEILIFPYLIGAFIFHLKSGMLIKKLDTHMQKNGCIKIMVSNEN